MLEGKLVYYIIYQLPAKVISTCHFINLGNQLTPVIAVFSSKLKDYGEAMSLHSCALGIGMPLTLCNFALQPGN